MGLSLIPRHFLPNFRRYFLAITTTIVVVGIVILMCHIGVAVLIAFVAFASVVSELRVGVIGIPRRTRVFALV